MSIYKGFCKDERFWPPTSQKFQPNLNTVIYTVPKCQMVLDPNLPKVLVISWVPQILEDSAPNNSKVPQCQTVLFKGFHNAKRFWPQTSQKLHNASVMYRVPQILKDSAPNNSKVPQCQTVLFTGFRNAKPPKSSAMPNTVIYRVLQCQKVLDPNVPKVAL